MKKALTTIAALVGMTISASAMASNQVTINATHTVAPMCSVSLTKADASFKFSDDGEGHPSNTAEFHIKSNFGAYHTVSVKDTWEDTTAYPATPSIGSNYNWVLHSRAGVYEVDRQEEPKIVTDMRYSSNTYKMYPKSVYERSSLNRGDLSVSSTITIACQENN